MGIQLAKRGLFAQPKTYRGLILLAFAGVIGFGGGACAARGAEISPIMRILAYLGFPTLMTYWLRKDGRINETWSVWDFGFFIYMAWPIVVPYHLVRTRRLRGLLPIAAFLGTFIITRSLGYLLCES